MLTCNHQEFSKEFQVLLSPGSSVAQSMLAFLKRSLAQFRLTGSYSPTWVLSEAYMRALNLLETGEQIEKPIAWIRATAYNIIREQSRDYARFRPLEEGTFEYQVNYNSVLEETEEEFRKVNLAFDMLQAEEKEILSLKVIEDLSWKEIRMHPISNGNLTEATLRKRKERALKRLRSVYHSLPC